ncbi:MAG: hypothetical protein KAS62_10750, partial [Candidatus Delongbacteria bacterium]|nr:hypothetical protein [Candidatus Delongbacteria bacterium]
MFKKATCSIVFYVFLISLLLSCTGILTDPGEPVDPFISLISPDGGENLQVGAPFTIKWEANFSENINIQFYRGLGSDILEMDIPNIPNSGQCVITPLFDMSQGTNYKAKVQSVQNNSINDISEMYFEVSAYVSDGNNDPFVATTLSLPHTGNYAIYNTDDIDWYKVYLHSGNKYIFKNTSDDDFDSEFYLYSGNSSGTDIVAEVAHDDDSGVGLQPYIEYEVYSTGYYYLRVAYRFDKSKNKQETNIGYYTLEINNELSENILITSPNGGEVWVMETDEIITWIDQNSNYVDID